jgi:hypothetical protein
MTLQPAAGQSWNAGDRQRREEFGPDPRATSPPALTASTPNAAAAAPPVHVSPVTKRLR